MFCFFSFYISFIIFYLFQLGLKYVENNLLAPEKGPQGPWSPHQVFCGLSNELDSTWESGSKSLR